MTVMGTDPVTGSPLFAPRLPEEAAQQALTSVAVLGLGYVGLPTSIGLAEQGMRVIGVEHVYPCCSGTFAVELALRMLKVGPGDEVILAGYDFPGNFRAIEAVGATPVPYA